MKIVRCAGLAAAAAFFVSPALAADLPVKAPIYKAQPGVAYNWAGFYVGGDVGYGWQNDQDTETIAATGAASPFSPADANKPKGVLAGGYAGYNWQFAPNWVAGLEADLEYADLTGTLLIVPPSGYDERTDYQGSVRGRLGYAFDRVLVYATGGYAFAHIKYTYNDPTPPPSVDNKDSVRNGWTLGGGIDYAITNNLIARIEYRYADFGKVSNTPNWFGGAFVETHRTTENAVRAGLAWKFGG